MLKQILKLAYEVRWWLITVTILMLGVSFLLKATPRATAIVVAIGCVFLIGAYLKAVIISVRARRFKSALWNSLLIAYLVAIIVPGYEKAKGLIFYGIVPEHMKDLTYVDMAVRNLVTIIAAMVAVLTVFVAGRKVKDYYVQRKNAQAIKHSQTPQD